MPNLLLKHFIPLPKIENFNTYLFVGPHPDDIEISCGSTVAKLVAQNKKIKFLIVTDGGIGSIDPKIKEKELIEIRKNEAINSAKVLGVNDIQFLDFKDGGDYDNKDIEKEIMKVINSFAPEIVFCPDPKVSNEFHSDHINIGNIVTNLAFKTGFKIACDKYKINNPHEIKAVALYYTDKPNSYVKINNNLIKQKMEAVRCHKSQFTTDSFNSLNLYFKVRSISLGLKSFKGKADGYRAFYLIHMHCMPEANKF